MRLNRTEVPPALEESAKKGFYDISYLLKKEKILSFCVGKRGTRKTSTWLYKIFRDCLERDEECALFYRHQNKVNSILPKDFYTAERLLNKDAFEGQIEKKGNALFWVIRDEIDPDNPTKVPEILESTLLAHLLSINSYNTQRSNDFSRVYWIFMDEFQTDDGKYLTQECAKLMNFVDTIARGFDQPYRPVRIILASNPIDLFNPYYTYFRIVNMMDKSTSGEAERFCTKSIAFEYHQCEIDKGEFAELIQGTEYGEHALHGVYKNDPYKLIYRLDQRAIKDELFNYSLAFGYAVFYEAEVAKQKVIYKKYQRGVSSETLKDYEVIEILRKLDLPVWFEDANLYSPWESGERK